VPSCSCRPRVHRNTNIGMIMSSNATFSPAQNSKWLASQHVRASTSLGQPFRIWRGTFKYYGVESGFHLFYGRKY
jgi:hypothetical protein